MHRIAIVDDSFVSALLLKHTICRLPDVEAETFQDPVDLLSACATGRLELVVADNRVPTLDGAPIIDALRRLPGRDAIPVIIVSGQAKGREQALHAGAAAVAAKPVEPLFLREIVASLLGINDAAHPVPWRGEAVPFSDVVTATARPVI